MTVLDSWLATLARLPGRRLRAEWSIMAPHRGLLARSTSWGQAAAPRDPRPANPARGQAILDGQFTFAGLTLDTEGPGGDPWNRASPSRAFAVLLHGLDWLGDVVAAPDGARAALSLALGWQATFGRWNAFSWSPPILERRLFNLCCHMQALLSEASAEETRVLLDGLARQARRLLAEPQEPPRAAERAAAAALAGCVLADEAGAGLREQALRRLHAALPVTVLADGVHASRSPEAGLELLLDLRALDDGLNQLGIQPSQVLMRAIDRLTGALRLLTLADGALPAMQGGEAGDPARIAAARGQDAAAGAPPTRLPHGGYALLSGRNLQVLVDVAAPAAGSWSQTACAQPLAFEVVAGSQRLITGAGWSPRVPDASNLRLTAAGSCAAIGEASAGRPLHGLRARVLGPRLIGAAGRVEGRRHDRDAAAWLDYSHDGWARDFGLIHDRRLYLDMAADDLRGEDTLRPASARSRPRPGLLIVRFPLHPRVDGSVGADHRSVLLRTAEGAWRLRTDAPDVSVEPATHLVDGGPHAASQIVLKTPMRRDGAARIRWKLSAER
jgi:uncharacterized heparinase superfamily protein